MVRATKESAELPPSIRESVERARAKAPPPPGPDPVPAYLACVYREVTLWLQSSDMLRAGIRFYYEKHFHKKILKNYFRFLIELSAGPHVSPQEKSKYVAVLRYAQACNVPPKKFINFLREQGGIKGTIGASKTAKSKKTPPRKRVSN
jgi:hypothetical protein